VRMPRGNDLQEAPRRRYAPRMPPDQRREQLIDAALAVILEQGYSGISIEAVARVAGVTRPVVYDHFPNLGRLLHALIEREERVSLLQLSDVVPEVVPPGFDPAELLSQGVRRFLDAVASRPATWRLILLPLDGTPAIVRQHVEANRARTRERIERLVHWALSQPDWPGGVGPREIDVELTARAVQSLGEEAGRMVLTDAGRYSPERYEHFVASVMRLV
jgi:AcrR family transcriptional regulator